MKADFETVAAVVSFITDAGASGGLIAFLERADFKEVQDKVREKIASRLSDPGYVREKNKSLGRLLFSATMVVLHFINVIILVGFLVLLILGPDNLPPRLLAGTTAEPLTPWERILYTGVLVIAVAIYVFRCAAPTCQALSLYIKAKAWLKENDKT